MITKHYLYNRKLVQTHKICVRKYVNIVISNGKNIKIKFVCINHPKEPKQTYIYDCLHIFINVSKIQYIIKNRYKLIKYMQGSL